ncbi:DUF2584 family protein [Ectobacillus ponti]|uniref:DUF2584 domain-containing protein n=1 Tax=Ectobacillus ponti TaxID=2961894 RepID=A0AA41XCG7_9BACI|nr:DUF2584 family protein [Ectobacillus ponti]MCP8970343.1 DUF2584 domain-containing protein [Ectobacillus ponti]
MKFEIHTSILTNDLEMRADAEHNLFELTVEGYHLYPLQEAVTLYRTEKEKIGTAVPKRISWEEGKTILLYQLVSLHSVN